MISLYGRGRGSVLPALVAGVLMFTAGGVAASAAAAQPAGGVAPPGGGYVASLTTLHAAQMKLQVPAVRCVAGKSSTVSVGMFGSTESGSTRSSWRLIVIASCKGRHASYRGVQSDQFGRSTVLRLRAGDRVRLLRPSASDYEIDDLTTHASAGGGSASAGGEQPTLASPVFFGVQVNGSVARVLHVHVLRARVNSKALGAVVHHRQRQLSSGRAVARATGLHHDGAFTLTVSKTSRVRSVPAPVITSMSSHSGTTAGNATLTIYGRYLADLSYVQFGSARCRAYYNVTDNKLVIGTPDHAATGTVDVRVRTKQGLSAVTAADDYTYTS